jgi:hypothetical protein
MTTESVTGQTAPDDTQAVGTRPARRTYGAGAGLPNDAASPDTSTAPAPADDGKLLEAGPYVGARPFTTAETVLLAGREREADELANMVVAGTLTVVYGASGVGKTSLLNAKLPERLDPMDPGWGARTVAFGRWQPGFYQDLAQVIAPFAGGRDLQPGLLAASLIAAVQADDCPVTLIFDQFEEYFLYNPHGDGEFAPELARLANVRDSPVHIVLSLRSDGLFLLDRLRLRIPDIFRRLYQVLPLSEDGARDAIIEPLKRYNEAARRRGRQPVVVPQRDAPVVDALVKGSEDGRIRSLLGRGKGTGSTSRDPDSIVAPFLQLALLKLWVNTAGRSEVNNPIDVPPLLRLAANGGSGGRPGDAIDPVDAVRRIMQCHVAKVLRTFADLRTQQICATIFSRMVTSEGGKVAVTVETAAAGLEPQDQAIVAAILARLASMSGEERLIRVAGDIEGQKTYEVQHDALGILLLDWVERWHREDAVRRARAWNGTVVKRTLAGVALVALAGAGWFGYEQFAARRDIVAQAEKFATSPSANGYRVRILTMLAALDDAEGVWSKLHLVDTDGLQDLLRQMLHRAPRWGGVAASAGIDADGTRLALVGVDMETLGESPQVRAAIYSLRPQAHPSDRDCPLGSTPDGAASAGLTGAPAIISGPPPVGDQPNPQLSFVNEAAGFVGSEPCPILLTYRMGTVSYWTGEADGWRQTKLDDLIDNYQTIVGPGSSGQIAADMLPGVLQIKLINQSDRSLRAAIIPDGLAKPGDPLRGSGFGPVVKFSSPPPPNPRRPPLLSAANDYAAAFEQEPRNPLPGQLAGPVLVLQATGNASQDSRVKIAPPLPNYATQYNAHYYRSLSATFVVKDGVTYAVVRTPSEVLVIRPPGDGATASASVTTFVPPYDRVVETQSFWHGPPLAAVGADDRWRFAWMTEGGVAVLDSSDPDALPTDRSNQLNSPIAGKQPLLTSIPDVSRLQLSADGRVLSAAHSAPGGAQRIEVWDLSKAWEERLDDPRLDLRSGSALRAEACRIAAIEARGDRLLPEEMENNLGRTVRQPCGGTTATGASGQPSPPAG